MSQADINTIRPPQIKNIHPAKVSNEIQILSPTINEDVISDEESPQRINSGVRQNMKRKLLPFSPNVDANITNDEISLNIRNSTNNEKKIYSRNVLKNIRQHESNDELKNKIIELEKIILKAKEKTNFNDTSEFKKKMNKKKHLIKQNIACRKIQTAYSCLDVNKIIQSGSV